MLTCLLAKHIHIASYFLGDSVYCLIRKLNLYFISVNAVVTNRENSEVIYGCVNA